VKPRGGAWRPLGGGWARGAPRGPRGRSARRASGTAAGWKASAALQLFDEFAWHPARWRLAREGLALTPVARCGSSCEGRGVLGGEIGRLTPAPRARALIGGQAAPRRARRPPESARPRSRRAAPPRCPAAGLPLSRRSRGRGRQAASRGQAPAACCAPRSRPGQMRGAEGARGRRRRRRAGAPGARRRRGVAPGCGAGGGPHCARRRGGGRGGCRRGRAGHGACTRGEGGRQPSQARPLPLLRRPPRRRARLVSTQTGRDTGGGPPLPGGGGPQLRVVPAAAAAADAAARPPARAGAQPRRSGRAPPGLRGAARRGGGRSRGRSVATRARCGCARARARAFFCPRPSARPQHFFTGSSAPPPVQSAPHSPPRTPLSTNLGSSGPPATI
jgi:hypothetical protein